VVGSPVKFDADAFTFECEVQVDHARAQMNRQLPHTVCKPRIAEDVPKTPQLEFAAASALLRIAQHEQRRSTLEVYAFGRFVEQAARRGSPIADCSNRGCALISAAENGPAVDDASFQPCHWRAISTDVGDRPPAGVDHRDLESGRRYLSAVLMT
jgi:hypothetical protein